MGTATILVVDDERKIRDLVRSYLELEGYSVLVADSGERTRILYGVRNCDHALDLWIRSGRRRRAGASLDGLRSERPPFLVAWRRNALTACGPFRTGLQYVGLRFIPSGWRQGASLGPSSKAIHTDLIGGQLGRSRRSQGF